jgi:ABC-type transport system involved in multi-copper enzyme maturation permease subunit
MNIGLSKSVRYILKPSWLTGPIFDKELRVSSRRRRNYVLRFAYLAILTVFVVLIWHSMVKFQGAAAYRISQMSEAGLAIITTIIMFQFIATQLIAVVMLSTSISDEIYNRTLGVLMTTPINSFQIVMGKLFSKLLQIILLLAISLPLLATVRVFGGVPWDYIISSVCITLTAVIFAGVLSLYFSIGGRRAYAVILKTLFTLGTIYLFIPIMVVLVSRSLVPTIGQPLMYFSIVTLPNPFVVMQFNTAAMMSPGGMGIMPVQFLWPLHCGIMLGASALLLAWSMRIVRRVALRQAAGQLDLTTKNKHKSRKKLSLKTTKSEGQSGLIRHVKGSPVVWKELRTPIIQGSRKKNIIGLVITIIALLITYAVNMKEKLLDEDFAHIAYTLIFVIIGLITNIVLSATTITTEKETRSWPILLATSMSDWQILIGKAVGVFRRCLPIWLLLAGHLILFITVRYIHPIAVVHLAILVTWIVVFLSGSGLYFSARLKRTTSAVVANFALALTLWAVIPLLLGMVSIINNESDFLETYILANPVVQTVVIMEGAGGSRNATSNLSVLDYQWPSGRGWNNIRSTTSILLITMLIYMSMGLLFAWRAKCRFRRNIF